MSLTSIAIGVLAIALIFLIIRLFMKTFKLVMAITIIIVILGGWLYGYSGVFNKVSNNLPEVSDNIPELGIQKIANSITGCTTELECAYVTNTGDCRMVKDYCNNVFKEDNYKKVLDDNTLEEDCNRTSIEIDYNIDCDCKLHKEIEETTEQGIIKKLKEKIKKWLIKEVEEKAGYTYCWKKEP
jgi:DNA-directed RNA polymerase beta' subunit